MQHAPRGGPRRRPGVLLVRPAAERRWARVCVRGGQPRPVPRVCVVRGGRHKGRAAAVRRGAALLQVWTGGGRGVRGRARSVWRQRVFLPS
eukprot:306381-Chlamydomonas_euryale.AAC.9